jgi:hypothetical protein
MKPFRNGLFAGAFVVPFAVAHPGCSGILSYEVIGVVKDATTGEGVHGAQIMLKSRATQRAEGGDGRPSVKPTLPGLTTELRTKEDGVFAFNMTVLGRELEYRRPVWELVISKDGYHPETIDISPPKDHMPKSETIIRIASCLRPLGP